MKISCGIIIINEDNEILMGHVTGNKFFDIPKGMKEAGEDAVVCAIRECEEEIGMLFSPEKLQDIGVYAYNKEKQLHLFITHVNKQDVCMDSLVCNSFFEHFYTKKMTPEVDSFSWIHQNDVVEQCAKSMGKLLTSLISDGVFIKPMKNKPKV